jgi:outer membrane lipoprotein-sorting protein
MGRVVLTLLALLGPSGAASPAKPDLFDEIHATVRLAEAKRQTIRARFTETTTSSLLVKPIVARGVLIGAKPARLLMQYASPDRKTILMDGNRLLVVWPGRGESERVDIAEIMKRVNRYFANATPDQLRKSFTVRAFVDPDMPDSWQLDLLPTRKQIREGLERLQIWITRDPLLLEQIKITFPGGDDTTFRLEDAELNVPLTAHAFDVAIPPAKQK